MSNEKTFPDEGCEPGKPFISCTPPISSGGATTTRFDSSIRSCTPSSDGRETSSSDRTFISPAEPAQSLNAHVGAPDYVARIAAVAARVGQTTEQPDLLALLREATVLLGVDCAVFISIVRDDATLSSCRFLLACDPAWCRDYVASGAAAHDPWLTYATHHSEPIVAASLPVDSAEQRRVANLAEQYGFVSTVLVPAHSGAGHARISLLCLGSKTPNYFDTAGFGLLRIAARALAMELHDWWLARIRRELTVRAHITASDLVLLRHEHQGHSSKQIAAELRVSACSVNSRFQRMNVKLGVPNRKMAARLALECGLILI